MKLSHVLLEIKVTTESLAARFASIGLLFVVGMHVKGEIVNLMERFVANCAFICLISAMSQLMILVIAFLVESFTTKLAHVWLKKQLGKTRVSYYYADIS